MFRGFLTSMWVHKKMAIGSSNCALIAIERVGFEALPYKISIFVMARLNDQPLPFFDPSEALESRG